MRSSPMPTARAASTNGCSRNDRVLERTASAALALAAAERSLAPLPVDPRKVLVVGDTPHDIACAKHIGAVSLAVATGTISREVLAAAHPDYLMDSLQPISEFIGIVDRL